MTNIEALQRCARAMALEGASPLDGNRPHAVVFEDGLVHLVQDGVAKVSMSPECYAELVKQAAIWGTGTYDVKAGKVLPPYCSGAEDNGCEG